VVGHLTIGGGVRERPARSRRARRKTLCARGAYEALLGGPSTSPLGRRRRLSYRWALVVVGGDAWIPG